MNGVTDYQIPTGPLCLAGPVVTPEPGALPLRGDLAHIAMAGKHLAAHYVIPHKCEIGSQAVSMRLQPSHDAETHKELPAGTAVELLDKAGDWAWICCGADGPAGYCLTSELAPLPA